jgi:hypothetical protein
MGLVSPNVSDFLMGEIGAILFLAVLFGVVLGVMMGFLFVKTVYRWSRFSICIRSLLFGLVLWLLPFALMVRLFPIFGFSTLGLFVSGLLLIMVADSILFAYVFNWLSEAPKPSAAMIAQPILRPLTFLFEPRTMGAFGFTAILTVLCILAWRMVQTLPRVGTYFTAQVSVLAFALILLFFAYALVFLAQHVFVKRHDNALTTSERSA